MTGGIDFKVPWKRPSQVQICFTRQVCEQTNDLAGIVQLRSEDLLIRHFFDYELGLLHQGVFAETTSAIHSLYQVFCSVLFLPDLASCHYSKATLAWYEANKVDFVPKAKNPPNCPELRPIVNGPSKNTGKLWSAAWRRVMELQTVWLQCLENVINTPKRSPKKLHKR